MQQNQSFTLHCLRLEWDPLMHHVGHPRIDSQHQELVRIGNVLIDLVQQPPRAERAELLEQFGLFHQVLVRHLKFEESLLATAVDEELLQAHNAGHRKFERFVQSIIEGYECRSVPNRSSASSRSCSLPTTTSLSMTSIWWIPSGRCTAVRRGSRQHSSAPERGRMPVVVRLA